MSVKNEILNEFKKFCAVPHCSFHTNEAFNYLIENLKNKGYQVTSDKAKNIHAFKGNPSVCLQSHYDMVCVGESSNNSGVQSYEENGLLKAKNSSLGADNGIGVAAMLALESSDIELLFTNDEEVGMIGANHLELGIKSSLLLNLDSEEINDIVVGCAGGADIECKISVESSPAAEISNKYPYFYRISSENFLGGHSGIEIHKNKANAIVEFGFFLLNLDGYVLDFKGGEKRNAIAVGIDSIILSKSPLPSEYKIPMLQTSDGKTQAIFKLEQLDSLQGFEKCKAHRAKEIGSYLGIIHSGAYASDTHGSFASLNLSLANLHNGSLELVYMIRANSDEWLNRLINRIKIVFENAQVKGLYHAWEQSIQPNHKAMVLLQDLYKKQGITPKITTIHAGLECGILKSKLLNLGSKNINVLSIGPTITSPHSINESLDLQSLEIFSNVLDSFVKAYRD